MFTKLIIRHPLRGSSYKLERMLIYPMVVHTTRIDNVALTRRHGRYFPRLLREQLWNRSEMRLHCKSRSERKRSCLRDVETPEIK